MIKLFVFYPFQESRNSILVFHSFREFLAIFFSLDKKIQFTVWKCLDADFALDTISAKVAILKIADYFLSGNSKQYNIVAEKDVRNFEKNFEVHIYL